MKSIWNNTFYNTQPALPWTFDISFDEYYTGDSEKNLGLSKFAQAAIDISIGKRESQYTDLYYGGLKFQRMTRAENTGTFTIRFNEDKYYTITGILENIYFTDNYNQYYGAKPDTGIPYNNPTVGNKKIVIKMYDPNTCNIDPNVTVKYEFYNCRIMSIDDISMSYENTSETIKRSVTFVYDHMVYSDERAKRSAAQARRDIAKEKAKRQLDTTLEYGRTLVGDQTYLHVPVQTDEEIKEPENYEPASNNDRGGQGMGSRVYNYSPIRTR